jgi:hypothetical protein
MLHWLIMIRRTECQTRGTSSEGRHLSNVLPLTADANSVICMLAHYYRQCHMALVSLKPYSAPVGINFKFNSI